MHLFLQNGINFLLLCFEVLFDFNCSLYFFAETKSFLLTLIVFITLRYADADGVISFVTQHVRVEEVQYAEATFNLKRESGSTGPVFFYCKVIGKNNLYLEMHCTAFCGIMDNPLPFLMRTC